jgi:conjugal transfer pilus assembly protein TrbC
VTSHLRPALVITLAFLAAGALGFAAVAQDAPEGIDLEAIRARAQAHAADAEALATTVRERGRAMVDQARDTASAGEANGRRYGDAARQAAATPSATTDRFDFDRLVADAGTMASESMGGAPRFIAFASTSLPAPALRAMLHDVTRAGGVVVFRGLPGGSVVGLTAALRQVLRPGEQLDGVGIDPRLFRAFHVDAVPAYVVAASDFEPCDGFDCTTAVPPHDRVSGNVTARYALETVANGGGPGAKIAALHLARLAGDQP